MTDIAVYLLPMPTLFRLQMPMIQRISLAALFGLGLLVVIAGIMRTYWVLYVEITYVEDPSYDLTWDSYNIWIWTALEANFAIICGCAPAIRRLFTKGGNQSQFKVGSSVQTIGSSGMKRKRGKGGSGNDLEGHGLSAFESRANNDNDASVTELVHLEGGDKKMFLSQRFAVKTYGRRAGNVEHLPSVVKSLLLCRPMVMNYAICKIDPSQLSKLSLPKRIVNFSQTNLDKFLKKELADATNLQSLKAFRNHAADVVHHEMVLVIGSRSKAVRIDAQVSEPGKLAQRNDCFAAIPVKGELGAVEIHLQSA
ncbi:hypothetical protein Brms1b_008989 [Colletotrichum noveboracense]|nr:hypothetical protein Brms1b_008989 [Colletotrichum noveboracense]